MSSINVSCMCGVLVCFWCRVTWGERVCAQWLSGVSGGAYAAGSFVNWWLFHAKAQQDEGPARTTTNGNGNGNGAPPSPHDWMYSYFEHMANIATPGMCSCSVYCASLLAVCWP